MKRPAQHANSERQKAKTLGSVSKTTALLVQQSSSPHDTIRCHLKLLDRFLRKQNLKFPVTITGVVFLRGLQKWIQFT